MRKLGFVLVAVWLSACGSECVDFTITPADLTCSTSSDCSWVGALHLCTGDPECGQENAVNVAAAARYNKETAGLSLKPVQCGAPTPVDCVQGQCQKRY
jgi:hypothetical protein